jgi:hypothetical protein
MYASVAFMLVPQIPFIVFALYVHPPRLAWPWSLVPPREWTSPPRAFVGIVGGLLCVIFNTVRWIALSCIGTMLYASKVCCRCTTAARVVGAVVKKRAMFSLRFLLAVSAAVLL